MMVGFDVVGLSLIEEKKTKSAHMTGISNNISSKTCSYLIFPMYDEMASTLLFFHFKGNCKDAESPSMMRNKPLTLPSLLPQLNTTERFCELYNYQLKEKSIVPRCLATTVVKSSC
jgi:hypothetical protein